MKTPIAVIGSILLVCTALADDSDSPVKYQGKLIDGTNLVNGTVGMVFRIYTNATTGDFFYEESNSVVVVDGFYSVLLGKHANYGQWKQAIKLDGAHIQVIVNGTCLFPREPFCPPPFSKSATAHWRVFSYPDPPWSAGPYKTFVGVGMLQQTLANLYLPMCKYMNLMSPETVYPCVFAPADNPASIKSVRFVCQTNEMAWELWNSGFSNNMPVVQVKVRDVLSEALLRNISGEIGLTGVTAGVWFTIPLTNDAHALTIQPSEFLEVTFGHSQTTGFSCLNMWGILIDVTIE